VNCRIKPVHKPEVGTHFTLTIIGIVGSHSTTIGDHHPPSNRHNDCAIGFVPQLLIVGTTIYFCYHGSSRHN
jgi:hypothetical protein